jgi:DNA-binding transcriptional LysR family regulator
MKRLNLLNVDLNLLVAFDALVIEGSVSRAANRIGVSQPAMSRSLRQLRELFEDELFRRTSDGMVPTPRAVDLARTIRPSLEHIEAAIGQRLAFDPATSERRFVLALPDLAARLALPAIVRLLDQRAPGIDLTILNTGNRDSMARVENGQAEIALGVYAHLPLALRSANLQPLREVCVADPDNPALKDGRLDIDRFLALPHVAVSMNEDFGTPVDTVLETLGLRRRVAVTTPFFVSVPSLVLGTGRIAVVTEALLDSLAEGARLARYPLPLPFDPVMSKMIWHARASEDAGHLWLRNLIVETQRYISSE